MAWEPSTVSVVAEPLVEPVTLAEAKAHLRVEHALDDAYIGALVVAARRHAEAYAWRAFVSTTFEAAFDEFPAACALRPCRHSREAAMTLARGTLQSVGSVTYVDPGGATQTLGATHYLVDRGAVPGKVWPAFGESWPATRDEPNAVRVRFVAGYGDAAAAVPADVKHAILFLVADLYERRESEIVGTIVTPVLTAARALLAPHRAVRF